MNIQLNNQPISLSQEEVTVSELLEMKGIKSSGTAVSVNDKLIRHSLWDSFQLKENDRVIIISAAFGG